jgi:hypothetical protein
MPETAHTEFWRDRKPINKVFRKHSLPEMKVGLGAEMIDALRR